MDCDDPGLNRDVSQETSQCRELEQTTVDHRKP